MSRAGGHLGTRFDSLWDGVTLGFAGGLCGDYVTTSRGLAGKFHNVASESGTTILVIFFVVMAYDHADQSRFSGHNGEPTNGTEI